MLAGVACPAVAELYSKYCLRGHDITYDIDGWVQDCSNSSALAMELLQSWTEPSTWQIQIWYSNTEIRLAYQVTNTFHNAV